MTSVRIAVLVLAALPAAAEQKTFPTPEAAVKALIAAVQAHNRAEALAIVGQEMDGAFSTGDPKRDEIEREIFLYAARKTKLEKDPDTPSQTILYVGDLEWPFPAPLVKAAGGWRFDGKAGVEEIEARRIGRGELAAIEICREYVSAQLDYFSGDRNDDGILEFARKIRSTPAKYDGLYWSAEHGEDESPLGPFIAEAAFVEAQPSGKPVPLFGYYIKILTAQGDKVKGGARDYLVDGRLLTGFALLAWPAEYGVSGVKSFLVSHLGDVYDKDLGADTARLAADLTKFNPDPSWSVVSE